MTLLALLVAVIVAAIILGSWSDPPRYPAPPDRPQRDLDMRRTLWR
jgi:hypothetical protein